MTPNKTDVSRRVSLDGIWPVETGWLEGVCTVIFTSAPAPECLSCLVVAVVKMDPFDWRNETSVLASKMYARMAVEVENKDAKGVKKEKKKKKKKKKKTTKRQSG